METRSRELPLTAAKPIYLRPRSLFPSLPPRFSVPSARCRSPPSGVSLRPAPAAFVIPLSLGRVPPAFQPVYKEDRVLHGDISLSRVLLGAREVEPERVAPAYARDPMWEGWRGGEGGRECVSRLIFFGIYKTSSKRSRKFPFLDVDVDSLYFSRFSFEK